MTTLTMTTATGRAAITDRIVAAIREAAPGAEIEVSPGWLDERETRIGAALNGATFFTSVKAASTWGVLGGWHTRDRSFCLSFGASFQGRVNDITFGKATGPHADMASRGKLNVESFERFLGRLTLAFECIANESAFQDAAA